MDLIAPNTTPVERRVCLLRKPWRAAMRRFFVALSTAVLLIGTAEARTEQLDQPLELLNSPNSTLFPKDKSSTSGIEEISGAPLIQDSLSPLNRSVGDLALSIESFIAASSTIPVVRTNDFSGVEQISVYHLVRNLSSSIEQADPYWPAVSGPAVRIDMEVFHGYRSQSKFGVHGPGDARTR